MKNETVGKQNGSTIFLKEREQYFKIQDLKAQLQDKNIAISELKKLIEIMKGKTVDTNFDKPSVVRQPNALKIPKPSVLGRPTPFLDSLERKSFSMTKSVTKLMFQKLNFVEEPVEILEREFKKLKRSRIAIVKVRWNSKRSPEFTWERKDQMKLKYPHLFSDILYRVDSGDFMRIV
ncbi:hypothetical protein Tco_1425439, partial [Tanacetum coccineum]